MSTIPKEIIEKLWVICNESDGFDIATKAYQLATYRREFWQLCPKCNGEGSVSTRGLSTETTKICDVCHGEKILERPNSERKELEKENERLKGYEQIWLEKGTGHWVDQITALQSQCTEKEKELQELKKSLLQYDESLINMTACAAGQYNQIEELKAENERLKYENKD